MNETGRLNKQLWFPCVANIFNDVSDFDILIILILLYYPVTIFR